MTVVQKRWGKTYRVDRVNEHYRTRLRLYQAKKPSRSVARITPIISREVCVIAWDLEGPKRPRLR